MTHIHPTIASLLLASGMFLVPALQPKAPPAPSPAQPDKTKQPAPPAPDAGQKGDKAANPAATPVERPEDYCKQRHARFNERAKEGHEKGDIDLIFFGDSITEGWEGAGKEAWEKNYGTRHAVNCGTGGDQTQHLLWRIQNGNVDGLDKPVPKDAHPPHLAVIMIGTNNMGNDTPEQIAGGVKAILVSLHEKLPHTKVLLLAIFPRSEKPDATREKVASTNKLLQPLADGKMVHYLDIGPSFVENDGTISKEIMPDSLHLSPKGYEVEAKALEPKIHELLGEK